MITERLDYYKLLYKFDFIADNSIGLKPEPAQIKICLEKLGISPEEAVMIGDMEGDIIAAKNANLKKFAAIMKV